MNYVSVLSSEKVEICHQKCSFDNAIQYLLEFALKPAFVSNHIAGWIEVEFSNSFAFVHS